MEGVLSKGVLSGGVFVPDSGHPGVGPFQDSNQNTDPGSRDLS